MRITWARRKASPSPRVNRMHFVMWDFLKMFFAAVVCGVAVSLAAAGIALVLANDAYAASLSNDAPTATPGTDNLVANTVEAPHPGRLVIGSGCDADALEAIERDWNITIRGKYLDVCVMQAFIVPPGDSTAATFNALLPYGARLLRLTAHTNGNLWRGKIFDEKAYGQLATIDFRNLSRAGLLIVQNDDGAISTDAIINIAATETVTIEYTYRLSTEEAQGTQNLFVTLTNENASLGRVERDLDTIGAVWVEWIDNFPRELTYIPSGAILETAATKIAGLSWETRQVNANPPFQLAWSK